MWMRKIRDTVTKLTNRTPAAVQADADDGPREARHDLHYNAAVSLTRYSKDIREQPHVYRARLVNLSKRGARLATEVEVPVGGSLRMELKLEEIGLCLHVAAEVCWARPGDDGGYEMGCSFDPGLPATVLDKMAQFGDLERRTTERHKALHECTILRRVDETEEAAVLRDYSEGGFRLVTGHPCEPGEELQVRLDAGDGATIRAKTLWQAEVDGAYLLGCLFVDQADAERFGALCEAAPGGDQPEASSTGAI